MAVNQPVQNSHSIGSPDLLRELALAFRADSERLLSQWRAALPERQQPQPSAAVPEQLDALLTRYLEALEAGSADELEQEARRLAAEHPPYAADSVAFLGALLTLRDVLARALAAQMPRSPTRLRAALDVFEPAANRISETVALGIVDEHARVIRSQQDAIRALSTPALQVRAGILLHPIVGPLDIHRARQLTSNLLADVRRRRAHVVVMDLTGVPTVDVAVATQLVHTVEAVRLLGAVLIISGISADTARALATTGLDLRALRAVGDLEDGMAEAEARIARLAATPVPRQPDA